MPSTVGPRRRVLVLLLAILVFTGTMYLVAAENESENDGVCSAGDTREECLEIFASANSESAEDVKNSWALASLAESNMGLTDVTLSGVYQSPIDLCDDLEFDEDCVEYVSEVKSQPFRCIVSIGEVLHSYEQPMNPTMASTIMKHLQWKQIIVIAVAIAFLTYFGIGTCREGWDDVLLNNFLYLFGMGLSIYLTTPAIHFFSWRSPIDIVRESFTAFQIVHPMESTAIVLSHFATYWLNIAAWFPGSVRSMLVWRLLYELVPVVNEYNHHLERELNVRCMRTAFMYSNDEYVIDRMLREYIAAPFFVYLYLLPSFVMHWATNFISSVGFA